jgi:hypothetical protein
MTSYFSVPYPSVFTTFYIPSIQSHSFHTPRLAEVLNLGKHQQTLPLVRAPHLQPSSQIGRTILLHCHYIM